jgi:Transposase and inactivated derivatives
VTDGLDTRLGTLNLSIPKLRSGGYVPAFMERWQRSEQALVATIHDIYVMGVSTRKVKALAESMGIESISAAEVSNMAKSLDEQVEAFRKQDFTGKQFPILWVDAIYEKVRVDSRVVSMAIEIVCGVSTDGHREVLAIEPMAMESKDSYLALFRDLRSRGLEVPKLIISDAHTGLVAAIQEGFPGASWQRCKVHFMRNILAHIPQRVKDAFAKELKQIWVAEDATHARALAVALAEKYRSKYPKAIECLENGLEDSLTFFSFPMIDQRKIASSNMIERLNKEIRRRTRVVGIFPNEASYMRLVCSYILEYAEDWAYERVYPEPRIDPKDVG